jgi:hypothetical protein
VRRNRLWFEEAAPVLQRLWETIEKERETGYEHRAPTKRKNASVMNTITSTEVDENETSTPVNKIIKLDNAIIPENHETTATSMARLMSLTASNHNNSHKKYSRVSNTKRPSDVLINCFKIDDLEMDESKIEETNGNNDNNDNHES